MYRNQLAAAAMLKRLIPSVTCILGGHVTSINVV